MKLPLVLAATVLAALAIVVTAFAHAEPATLSPGDGAVLAKPPTEVVIEMTQEMARQGAANDIEVFDAAGNKVTTQAAAIDNADRKKITVPLPPNLLVGTYTVKWKTLSADDGDAANGQFTFTYDPAKPAVPGNTNPLAAALGTTTPAATNAPAAQANSSDSGSASDGAGGGTSWVLLASVAVGMFVLGSGGTFLLVKKGA